MGRNARKAAELRGIIRPPAPPRQSFNCKYFRVKNGLLGRKENGGAPPRPAVLRLRVRNYSSRPPPGISRGSRTSPATNRTAVLASPAHMLWLKPVTRWPMPAQNITNKA